MRQSVLDYRYILCHAPILIAGCQEMTGCRQAVQLIHDFEEKLPAVTELAWQVFGKAGMAGRRRCLSAKKARGSRYHLPIVITDGQEFVKRQHRCQVDAR